MAVQSGQRAGIARLGRLFALADQGFQGLAGIVATAILGRALPHDQFGAVGTMIGVYYFVAGFHRSAIVLPYITEHFPHASREEARRDHSDWWWLGLGASVALALALVALAGVVDVVAPASLLWIVTPLLLGALITPPMLAVEFVRRWFFKSERPELAALSSLIFFVTLVGTAIVAGRLHPSATSGALCWVIAACCATFVALPAMRPAAANLRGSLRCWARHRGFTTWLSLNIFPYSVYSTATVVVLIGALVGPAAAAVFTAARTLTNPAVSLVSAIDSVDKPKAARALATEGMAGLRRTVGGTRRLLVLVTGAYLGLVALAAKPLLHFAFHDAYPHIENEVRLLCLAFFLFCLNQPSETMLIVLRASRTMFVTRSLTALVTLAALVVAIPHGVAGMACAVALSQLVNIGLLAYAERHVAARGGAGAPL